MTGKEERSNRIPIRFIDDDSRAGQHQESAPQGSESGSSADKPASNDLGRESSYDDETEIARRIERGSEGDNPAAREKADDRDVAGGPDPSETPERREDQDRGSGQQGASDKPPEAARQPSTTQPANATSGPAMAELVATRAELKRVEAENADLRESLARRQADFENFRKRVERERGESYNRIVGDVVRKLLPVLDNLRRALDAEASLQASESEEFRHFLNGVELISRQLSDVLTGLGVRPIESVGKKFDPHLHEAVTTEHNQEVEPDTVLQELVRGYVIGDKLLRPASVKVSTR